MIKIIRLTNGEQVVCDLSEGDDKTFFVRYGFGVVPDMDNPAQIKFYPFAPYSSKHGVVEVRKESVTFVSEPATEVSNLYKDIVEGNISPSHE
jgi:hypothetical protein